MKIDVVFKTWAKTLSSFLQDAEFELIFLSIMQNYHTFFLQDAKSVFIFFTKKIKIFYKNKKSF